MLEKRSDGASSDFLDRYKVDDSNGYMTSDVGGPIEGWHQGINVT
jgi:catalase